MKHVASATVLMSGGIDSTACAHQLRLQGLHVDAIYVDHGQAASRHESKAVLGITRHLKIQLTKIKVGGLREFGAGELVGRNAFLIFTALFAMRGRPGLLALGLHAGTPYYDCSEVFVKSIGRLVSEHTDGRVSVVAPFIAWTKKEVYDYFTSHDLPIALTYSCETGTKPVCGRCASCKDRKALEC